MRTYLDSIVAWHRRRAAADERPLDALRERAAGAPEPRGMRAALAGPGLSVIAEMKRRSPSKGDLAADLDPSALARAYQAGGAAALSVLTDTEHFGGSVDDLRRARQEVEIPVLRKDFTVSVRDVLDARIMGADAVLLIVAALSPAELEELAEAAAGCGLDALVEVHDEDEARLALAVGADLVGVNQRDLRTFDVDQGRAVRVAGSLPSHVVAVAESGVRGPEDAATLAAAGFSAVLVGESLVRSSDPEAAVRALTQAA